MNPDAFDDYASYDPEMTYGNISPKYMMGLVRRVEAALQKEYPSPDDVRYYLEKWYEGDMDYENFKFYTISHKLDLLRTLHDMPSDLLIRIAIDLGVDTPGMLPSIPIFVNTLKDQNSNAQENFERAVRNVCEHPDDAVALASSALEGLLKTIGCDKDLGISEVVSRQIGRKLVISVVRALGLASGSECPREINQIARSLQGVCDAVIELRSNNSSAHGHQSGEYVIDDPLWAELVVNATATVGLFLWEYYERCRKVELSDADESAGWDSDLPF